MLERASKSPKWWTFTGSRANASLAAALEAQGLEASARPLTVAFGESMGVEQLRACAELLIASCEDGSGEGGGGADLAPVEVDPAPLEGLKLAELLPPELAAKTLASRLTDPETAAAVAMAARLSD